MVVSNKSLLSTDLTSNTSEVGIDALTDKAAELRRRYYAKGLTKDDGSFDEWMSLAMFEYNEDMEGKSRSWANALYFSALGGPKTCVPQIALQAQICM